MNHYISLFLIIIFFTILFYTINKNKNLIISYQTIKQNKLKNYDLKKLNNEYERENCDDYCSRDICADYDVKLNNYKKCLECQKKFKCYNVFTDECENCISFGIGQCMTPVNPKYNLCKISND